MTRRCALVVPAYAGQPTVEEHQRRAHDGLAPRRDHVELATALDAEVLDQDHLEHRSARWVRALASRAGSSAAQIAEVFHRRDEFSRVCLWSDRFGLPLALLHKVTRSRDDLVLVSTYLSSPKKALFLHPLRAHTHLGAVVNYSSVQREIAATRLHVPREKLHHAMQSVDERFWTPVDTIGDVIASVGWWEYRDYATLFAAVQGLDVRVEVAVGKTFRAAGRDGEVVAGMPRPVPPNVVIHDQLSPVELRALYARARAVVVPVRDVEFDVGATTIGEAMAMARPVIVTRTRGQADFVTDGVDGLYVPPGDAESLRAQIVRVLANPHEAVRMGRAGREFAERELRLDDYVRRVAAIVEGAGALVA